MVRKTETVSVLMNVMTREEILKAIADISATMKGPMPHNGAQERPIHCDECRRTFGPHQPHCGAGRRDEGARAMNGYETQARLMALSETVGRVKVALDGGTPERRKELASELDKAWREFTHEYFRPEP